MAPSGRRIAYTLPVTVNLNGSTALSALRKHPFVLDQAKIVRSWTFGPPLPLDDMYHLSPDVASQFDWYSPSSPDGPRCKLLRWDSTCKVVINTCPSKIMFPAYLTWWTNLPKLKELVVVLHSTAARQIPKSAYGLSLSAGVAAMLSHARRTGTQNQRAVSITLVNLNAFPADFLGGVAGMIGVSPLTKTGAAATDLKSAIATYIVGESPFSIEAFQTLTLDEYKAMVGEEQFMLETCDTYKLRSPLRLST